MTKNEIANEEVAAKFSVRYLILDSTGYSKVYFPNTGCLALEARRTRAKITYIISIYAYTKIAWSISMEFILTFLTHL